LLRLLIEPLLRGNAPFALYYLPILLTAWYGSAAATALATVAALLSAWLLFGPEGVDRSRRPRIHRGGRE
jgi:hypothetical protein